MDTPEPLYQAVQWYRYRWRIERFHFTLKSGCGVEDLQLETTFPLRKALATDAIVAWRLMWLTYRARLTPDEPCDTVLTPAEGRLLQRKFTPKCRSRPPPPCVRPSAGLPNSADFSPVSMMVNPDSKPFGEA